MILLYATDFSMAIPEEFCTDSIIKNNVKASLYYVENNPIKHGIVDNLETRRFRSMTDIAIFHPGENEVNSNLEADLE